MPQEKKHIKETLELKATIAEYIDGDATLKAVAVESPVVIAALATGLGTSAQRDRALVLIRQGHIRAAEEVFGLPRWYRRLGVSAFGAGIPIITCSALFEELIAPSIPPDAETNHAKFFLSFVTAMAHADENFFLWLAHQMRLHRLSLTERQTALVAMYATFSQIKSAPAAAFMQHPWTPQMSLKVVANTAQAWFAWLVFVCVTPNARLADTWRRGGTFGIFEIKELTTPFEVRDAANALQNCAYQYAPPILANYCRLFSVSRNGGIVAMFDLYSTGEYLVPNQIKGIFNEPASSDVHRAVYAFLAVSPCSEDGTGMPRRTYKYEKPAALACRWTQAVAPYVQARGNSVFLPSKPTAKVLTEFVSDNAKSLGRIAEGWVWQRMPLLRE